MPFSLLSAGADGAAGTPAWVALAYLVAGVFFIFALRGLSSPSTSRTGNRFGMAGMLIAVVTTLLIHDIASLPEIGIAIAIGGGIGFVIARRIAMTAMPQLVAAFHSLVGLAAVLVALAAFMNPLAFNIADAAGQILLVSRIELALGAAIGAITFSGSVIAFAKLNGNMSGSPILLPGRHVINLGTLGAIIGLTGLYAVSPMGGARGGNRPGVRGAVRPPQQRMTPGARGAAPEVRERMDAVRERMRGRMLPPDTATPPSQEPN